MSTTYTKKQVFMAILPWSIIGTMIVFSIGAASGWFIRSNFQNEVAQQVNSIMEKKANAK